MKLFMLGALVSLLCGCASAPPPEKIPVIAVSAELKKADSVQAPLLNVGIQAFTSAEASGSSLYSAARQVRSIEQRYLPYLLKNTLDSSGFWGAVRVVPKVDATTEVMISGQVIESSGSRLTLLIHVEDATGRVWFEKAYSDLATELDYATDPVYTVDPFQDLYNQVANDMVEVLSGMSDAGKMQLMDVALVRYGVLLSPESFDRYLAEVDGVYQLDALPAREDPLYQRVLRIRESEYLFSDSVDAHYESLYHQLGPTYAWWRYYGYELIAGNERLGSIDATRGATRGSWYAMERIYKTFRESRMNEDALRQLTESFDREARPTVTEIAGQLVELGGTLDEQYIEWRRILRQMYQEETGF